jgi:hypothetical protein
VNFGSMNSLAPEPPPELELELLELLAAAELLPELLLELLPPQAARMSDASTTVASANPFHL